MNSLACQPPSRTARPWLLLALLTLLSHGAPAQVAPSATLTFNATADTYVDSGSATTNFNSSTVLRADASPTRIIYLRFALSGIGGRHVQQARLRLGVNAASPGGGTVHLISNNAWNEATVTYNTRPAVDGAGLQTLGAVTAGATVEFTLDGAITADGVYNLAIDSTNSLAVGYNSSVATSGQKPQLVLTVAADSPTVTIAQPPSEASYFVGDAITLQASAHDGAGVDLSTHVVWTSNLAGPLGTGAVVTTSLGEGTHTVTASVTDGQDLTGSSQITLTVTPPPPGNTAPLVTITAPTVGQTLASSAPITFTGGASDLEDGDLTAAISWTSDRDGALGTGGTITHMLSEGTHQLTATVTDRGGLSATAIVTVQVVVGVAREFPAVADASVDSGLPTTNFGTSPILAADANLVRNTYLRFNVSGLAARTILGAVLRLEVDATPGAESASGGVLHTITDGTWRESAITFNNRPAVDGPTIATQGPVQLGQTVDFDLAAAVTGDGAYNFAIVNDSADECDYRSREGGPAPTLIVTVARTAPTVIIAAPAAGSVFFEHDAITFAAEASDADDGDLSSRIEWTSSRDGGLGTGATVTTSGLTVGLHTVTAAVTDADGLRGQAQASLRVRAPNTPPAVTIASPADGSSVPAGTAVRLGAAASDDFDGDLSGQIRWTSSRDGALG
ncbi:MAG TPA: DNRLRE domain-containing protein, partial [Solirubrobacteraceae bacterium]